MTKTLLALSIMLSSAIMYGGCSSVRLNIGDKAPQFALLNQDGQTVHLSDFMGQKVALYFYPKDNTPGCSQQACSLRDDIAALHEAGITILGLSRGSVKSKQSFIKKKHLPFTLLIATDNVLKAYGVYRGFFKLYLPKRWTFLIDENGIIVAIIKDVNTKHHAQQILDAFDVVK